jgi:hypothetical protein
VFKKIKQLFCEKQKKYERENFFDSLSERYKGKAYSYVVNYYPNTPNKDDGWKMIEAHHKNNIDMLLCEFDCFCIYLCREIRINNLRGASTSVIYQTLIDVLIEAKNKSIYLEKKEND